MSKRVYEIANDTDLETREVLERLNEAGVEVKSNLAVVDDLLYERVFGEDSDGENTDGAAPNGRLHEHEAEGLRSRRRSLRQRSPSFRVVMYILAAALAFVLAVGVGAVASLIMQTV